jgi:hypothetical protein
MEMLDKKGGYLVNVVLGNEIVQSREEKRGKLRSKREGSNG